MAQFAVYKNNNPRTSANIPYVLDVQTDLLNEIATRAVIPLYRENIPKLKVLTRLTPLFTISDERCILMTPQLAGVPTKQLGASVCDLSEYRADILSALDMLVTGF